VESDDTTSIFGFGLCDDLWTFAGRKPYPRLPIATDKQLPTPDKKAAAEKEVPASDKQIAADKVGGQESAMKTAPAQIPAGTGPAQQPVTNLEKK
jgi:hypothetical protein